MDETIVFVHGMWVDGGYWAHVKRFFEEKGYRCLTPTLRHHGRPPAEGPHPELGTTSVLDYVEDLEAEIRVLDAPPVLIGHSMGGLLVQILAGRGLAKAAILLAPASPAGVFAIRISVLRSFLSGYLRWGFWRKPYRQTFGEAVYGMMHLLPPETQREIYAGMGYESGRAACEIGFWLFDRRRAAAVGGGARQGQGGGGAGGGIECPLLVVAAEQDRITPAAVVRKVARRYGPRVTYREFSGRAHSLLYEPGWEEIATFCEDWLRETLGPAPAA